MKEELVDDGVYDRVIEGRLDVLGKSREFLFFQTLGG